MSSNAWRLWTRSRTLFGDPEVTRIPEDIAAPKAVTSDEFLESGSIRGRLEGRFGRSGVGSGMPSETASPRSCGWRGPLLELSLLVALLSPTTASIGCAFGQAPPSFADQALARGVQYPVQAIPQSNGVYGFGVAAADLDGDGSDDIIAVGRLNGQVGVYRNLGTGHFENRSATSGIAALPQASAIACADMDGYPLPNLDSTSWHASFPIRPWRS